MKIKQNSILLALLLLIALSSNKGFAQLSPGDLAKAHEHLEGLSNCTNCHVLGNKITNDKCLKCHKPLKNQIDKNKGYHASKDIKGKDCISCHSDHHGKKFEMIRFNKNDFNHLLTGYKLENSHNKLDCSDCHKKEFINDSQIKKKKNTFLGLNTKCLTCHTDYHQETLSKDCIKCHDYKKFAPASKFDHENAKFQLIGKHKELDCIECHELSSKNGEDFQQFTGIAFKSCTSCHEDIHEDKFGQNCTKCHNEQSFHSIKKMKEFNHDRTDFKLIDKHELVECKDCHKTKLTDPVKHNNCTDCHDDYHKGQLKQQNVIQDCDNCHSTKGFTESSYTIERHDKTEFPLKGAHLATPCFVCHKDKDEWAFKSIGINCSDCHENIHENFIDKKYYPEENCENCHTVNIWSEINFDHSLTNYELKGKHKKQTCRSCHFETKSDNTFTQKFQGIKSNCLECHEDEHQKQFEIEGKTDCLQCHTNNNWKAEKFNHKNTLFPLDGQHKDVACSSCHKEKQIGTVTFVEYKLKEYRCENCH